MNSCKLNPIRHLAAKHCSKRPLRFKGLAAKSKTEFAQTIEDAMRCGTGPPDVAAYIADQTKASTSAT